MKRTGAALAALAVVAVVLTACARDEPPPAPAPKQKPAEPAIETPDDVLGRALAKAAGELAQNFTLDEAAFRVKLADGERRDLLAVLVAEHCFRILGVAGLGIEDLELVLFDGDGVQVRRDLDDGSRAAIGVDASLCPPVAAEYRLQVSAKGAGEALVGVYRILR